MSSLISLRILITHFLFFTFHFSILISHFSFVVGALDEKSRGNSSKKNFSEIKKT